MNLFFIRGGESLEKKKEQKSEKILLRLTKEQKEQSFVVRLGEGTEFEMSFDTK